MDELKGYVIESLKDGEPVWFGSDVLAHTMSQSPPSAMGALNSQSKISKEQLAKMAQAYKKAETQHVAQRAVTKNGILASAESVEVLESMSPKNFAFSIGCSFEISIIYAPLSSIG